MKRHSAPAFDPDPARLPGILLIGVALLSTVWWLAVALFLRPIGDYGVETDFYGDIVYYARKWMEGHPSLMNGFRGPAYYLVIGALERLFGDAFTVGKVLSALCAGLAVWLTGRLLTRIWNPWVGLFGAMFLAANSVFAHHALRACTDLPYLGLYLGVLTLLFFHRGVDTGGSSLPGTQQTPWMAWAVAGVLAGLATTTRYNGLVLLPVGAVVALLLSGALRQRMIALASFLGAFVLTMAPWSGFLLVRTGNPLWNTNFKNVAIDVYTSHAGVAQAGRFIGAIDFTSIGEVYHTAPGRFLGRMVENLWTHFRADVVELVGVPWACASFLGLLVAIIRGVRSRRQILPQFRSPVFAFAVVGFLSFLALVPAFYNARFMLPLLPFWAVGVGLLGNAVIEFGNSRLARQTPGASLPRIRGRDALGVILLLLVPMGWSQVRELRSIRDPLDGGASPTELLEIVEKARRSGFVFGPRTPVSARKPHLGYYLDTPTVSLVPGSLERIRESGAHYLLVSGIEASWSGSLVPLLYPQSPEEVPRGFDLVAQAVLLVPDGRERPATLYAVKDPVEWEPSPLVQRVAPGTTIPGLDRLDTLRLRIARWIHFWDGRGDPRDLIARIRTRDHPEVLLLRGDRALMDRDAPTARSLYERALPLLEDWEQGVLRLAAIGMLTDDDALVDAQFGRISTPERAPGQLGAAEWLELASRYRSRGDRMATLAPTAFALSLDPNDARIVRTFGLTLFQIGWPGRGRPILQHYLEAFPGDEEVREILETTDREM